MYCVYSTWSTFELRCACMLDIILAMVQKIDEQLKGIWITSRFVAIQQPYSCRFLINHIISLYLLPIISVNQTNSKFDAGHVWSLVTCCTGFVQEIFQTWDRDGSGDISVAELARVLTKLRLGWIWVKQKGRVSQLDATRTNLKLWHLYDVRFFLRCIYMLKGLFICSIFIYICMLLVSREFHPDECIHAKSRGHHATCTRETLHQGILTSTSHPAKSCISACKVSTEANFFLVKWLRLPEQNHQEYPFGKDNAFMEWKRRGGLQAESRQINLVFFIIFPLDVEI